MSNTLQSMKDGLYRYFTRVARARVRQELLYRSDDFLTSVGISRELLEQGVGAWPWRLEDAALESQPQPLTQQPQVQPPVRPKQYTGIDVSRRDYEKAVAELNDYSDAELADLGISRSGIKYAVRHGRPGIDDDFQRDAA